MDRARVSWIGHRTLSICNPLSGGAVDRVIEWLSLERGARVIDFGAGKCELLFRLAARRSANCTGVEISPRFAEEARRRAQAWDGPGGVVVVEGDAAEYARREDAAGFDAALCIGASGAFGGRDGALAVLRRCARPGGAMALGEGFWRQQPDPQYLASLGASEDEMEDHAGNIAAGERLGLSLVGSVTATEAEWDAYEGAYLGSIESFAAANPGDAEAAEMRAWAVMRREAYERWGRATLGFGVYVFRAPP